MKTNLTFVDVKANIVRSTIDVKGFVVPNSAVLYRDFFKSDKAYQKNLCALNEIELTDDSKFIHIWMHNEEKLESENLACHGWNIQFPDNRYLRVSCHHIQWVPYELIKHAKEGDTVTFYITHGHCAAMLSKEDNHVIHDRLDIDFQVNLTCQQQGYRYSNFGNFEDVVQRSVIAAVTA